MCKCKVSLKDIYYNIHFAYADAHTVNRVIQKGKTFSMTISYADAPNEIQAHKQFMAHAYRKQLKSITAK